MAGLNVLNGISAETAGTALNELQANILLLPTYIAPINTGEWKRQQEKREANNDTTSQKPGAETSHEKVSYRRLRQHNNCTTWPSHPRAPATEAGHVEESFFTKCYRCLMHQAQPCQGLHICFQHFSSARKQRKQKKNIMFENCTISDLSKENKEPLQMSDGSNLFLKEYCTRSINFPFLLNWGDIFCSERGSYGLVQSCSKMGRA